MTSSTGPEDTPSVAVDEAHVPTYAPVEAATGFECRVTCSCGDFDRTSTSAKGATQARANARASFTRHRHKVEAELEAIQPEPRPEPDPEPEPEPASEPPSAPTPAPIHVPVPAEGPAEGRLRRRGRASQALVAVVVAAIIAVVVLTSGRGDDERPPSSAPGSTPSGPPVGSLPPLPIQIVKGPPKAAFVDLLHRADPIFVTYPDSQLESGGRAICRDYGRGIGVVEIASTILATSTLDAVQAITMIAAAGRTMCPAYDGGIASEVSGLG